LHVTRPDEGFEEVTITGMLDCIGVVINALNPENGQIIASSVTHFVTGQNTTETGSLNPLGADILAEQFQIIERYGLTLSAIVMSAQGFGGGDPAPESAAGIGRRTALHVSNLIRNEGVPVETVLGPGARRYRLHSNGTGQLI
jgi:hypothetical protein